MLWAITNSMYKIEELKILRLLPDELQVILWKKYKDNYLHVKVKTIT